MPMIDKNRHRAVLAAELLRIAGDEATERRIAGGSYVFRAGIVPTDIYVLRSGRISLSPPGRSREQLTQVLQAPDVFGDGALFSRALFAVDARAMVDSVVMAVPSLVVLQRLALHPRVTRHLVEALAQRVLQLQSRLSEVLAGDVTERLALFLLGSDLDVIEVSQEAIADLLGAHRTTVHRFLHDLQEAGALTLGYRRVEILDRDALQSWLVAVQASRRVASLA